MKSLPRQDGYVSGLLIAVILMSVLFIGALGFGGWAYVSRQDYKNNSDKKVEAGQAVTKQETEAADKVKYDEAAKNPLKTYTGPASFGSVSVQYPKTWSAYVIEESVDKSVPVDAYLHPDVVPGVELNSSSFALRMQISQQTYDKAVNSHSSAIKAGRATSAPYTLPKVAGIVGTRIEGELSAKKQGTMIILPLRNVTLLVWTEGDQFKADFNNIILPNLSFSP